MKFKVIAGPYIVPEGTLVGLNEDQIRRRAPSLKLKSKNIYAAIATIQFKTGEIIELPRVTDIKNLGKQDRQFLQEIEIEKGKKASGGDGATTT